MGQLDIVARLQLRADQFSSETGARFAELKSKARSSAQEVRDSFGASFAEVQRLASQSLNVPRSTSGSLDLSGEIKSLQQAALESDRNAAALRELSIAQTAVAAAAREDAQALKLEADAAAVASLAHERDAASMRERAAQLQAVQTELNRTAVSTVGATSAAQRHVAVSGQQRQAMQSLGQQATDFSVQVLSGQSAMTAFAQQAPQTGLALSGFEGKLGTIGTFLTGPWGIALTIGASAAAIFVGEVLKQNNALEDAVDKLKGDAKATDINRQAKEIFARSQEGVAAAIRDSTEATKASIAAERSSAEQANITAKSNLAREISYRNATIAAIELAEAQERAARGSSLAANGPDGAGALVAARFGNEVAALKAKADEQKALIAAAEARVQETRIELAAEAAQRAVDPMARIKKLYDDQAAAARAKARAEGTVTSELTRQLAAIERNRRAAVEAEQERQRKANQKPREVALGTQLANEQGQRLLASARGYTGLSERDASGNATLRDLFKQAGANVDPKMTAWCAAFVNAVLATNGLPGTGALNARSFLNYGTATTKPTQGDIVVLRRGGNDAQGHVGFYAGEKNGRIQVTGGNQGDKVSTASFARSDVLGFRRAPTAAASYKAEAKEAAAELRELDSALEAVTNRLDPARKAASDYLEVLDQIAKLNTAGKLTDGEASELRFQAMMDEAARRQQAYATAARSILGINGDPLADTIGSYDRDRPDLSGKWDQEMERRQRVSEDQLRDLSDMYFDLFDSSSGNIWQNFERRAISALADVAARETLGMVFGQGQPAQGEAANDNAVTELRGMRQAFDRWGVKMPKGISDELKTAMQGAGVGAVGGSVFASITGGKNNAVASAAGGAIGEFAGKAVGKSLSGLLGSASSLAGPLGAIAGGILGNVVGGLFQKTKQASSTIGFGGDGLYAATAKGTGTAEKAAASASANSVVGSLNRIAEALGGDVTGAGSVSIGYRPGHKDPAYRVDTTGQGRLTGVLAFATEEEAIRAAIADALKDGVIGGISDASKRILAAGGDLEKAITKASLIESVPRDLKAMTDPLGAAIDDLNRKFQKTVDALNESGATAEQMAQAQRLYDLQLEQVKASTDSASASLKDFLADLKIGSDSPLSLRDREAEAQLQLQPFLDKITAGQAIDQSKYQAAAQTYLDIERQLYGSTSAFFQKFDAIQAATEKAIANIDNAVPITPAVDSPFAKATAASAATTATNTGVGNELLSQLSDQMAAMQSALDVIAGNTAASSGGGFIGTGRQFVQAA